MCPSYPFGITPLHTTYFFPILLSFRYPLGQYVHFLSKYFVEYRSIIARFLRNELPRRMYEYTGERCFREDLNDKFQMASTHSVFTAVYPDIVMPVFCFGGIEL